MSKTQWILSQLTRKLWFRSTLYAVLAVLTALIAIMVKSFIPDSLSGLIGTDAVDKILSILASSMLAVTTFSLNIMVSAYNNASSSVTPRATRLLVEDRTTQNVLATFIGSFLYSLVGIVALSMGAYGERGRVVLFFVTIAVIVMIVITLLRWIQHLAQFGHMAETSQRVEEITASAMERRMQNPFMGCSPWPCEGIAVIDCSPVYPGTVGYLQHIDVQILADFAEENQCYIYISAQPGGFVHGASPLLWTRHLTDDTQIEDLLRAFTIGQQRSYDQDPRFGLCVLSEIASRALSPAVNDPGTAIDVIGRAVRLFSIDLIPSATEPLYPRLFIRRLDMGDLFDDIFTAIARDGAGMIEVQIRLQKAFIALSKINPHFYGPDAKRHALHALLQAKAAISIENEIEKLEILARQVPTGSNEGSISADDVRLS